MAVTLSPLSGGCEITELGILFRAGQTAWADFYNSLRTDYYQMYYIRYDDGTLGKLGASTPVFSIFVDQLNQAGPGTSLFIYFSFMTYTTQITRTADDKVTCTGSYGSGTLFDWYGVKFG